MEAPVKEDVGVFATNIVAITMGGLAAVVRECPPPDTGGWSCLSYGSLGPEGGMRPGGGGRRRGETKN